jgi:hypothetical protein
MELKVRQGPMEPKASQEATALKVLQELLVHKEDRDSRVLVTLEPKDRKALTVALEVMVLRAIKGVRGLPVLDLRGLKVLAA